MPRLDPNNPAHLATRNTLRVLGPAVFSIGLIFVVIAAVSFFSSFGGFEPPRYFWCAFVGMPLMAVGGWMSQFGYMGAVARYMMAEGAPIASDTANYVAGEARPAIKSVASAIAEGIREGAGQRHYCTQCGVGNDSDARFCKGCGQRLG